MTKRVAARALALIISKAARLSRFLSRWLIERLEALMANGVRKCVARGRAWRCLQACHGP